jgi:hypothetical protein
MSFKAGGKTWPCSPELPLRSRDDPTIPPLTASNRYEHWYLAEGISCGAFVADTAHLHFGNGLPIRLAGGEDKRSKTRGDDRRRYATSSACMGRCFDLCCAHMHRRPARSLVPPRYPSQAVTPARRAGVQIGSWPRGSSGAARRRSGFFLRQNSANVTLAVKNSEYA